MDETHKKRRGARRSDEGNEARETNRRDGKTARATTTRGADDARLDATRRDALIRGERARSGSGDGARRERDATKKRAIEREGDEGDG